MPPLKQQLPDPAPLQFGEADGGSRGGFLLAALLAFVLVAAPLRTPVSAEESSRTRALERALEQFYAGDFESALRGYLGLAESCADCAEVHFMLGRCLLDLERPREAADYFRLAFEEDTLHAAALQHHALASERCQDYAAAAESYELFLDRFPAEWSTPESRDAVRERYLLNCERLRIDEYSRFNIPPRRLSDRVNSSADDYMPVIALDGRSLYFTSTRPGGMDRRGREGRYREDFWVSRLDPETGGGWSDSRNLGPPLNTVESEGAGSLSGDGGQFFFSACDRPQGFGDCDLYRADLVEGKWSAALNLGEPVNGPWWDSQPALSSDGGLLIFSSTRPGGFGGCDLWGSRRAADSSWAEPVNLGPAVNTQGDEAGPFLHGDGRTLYFSSDGHPGFGDLDIFYSVLFKGAWGAAVNLGRPINTPEPDLSFVVPGSGETGYFASRREGRPSLDLYRTEVPACCRPERTLILRGRILDAESGEPLEARVRLETTEGDGERQERHSSSDDGCFFFAAPRRSLLLSASSPGHFFASHLLGEDDSAAEELEIERDLLLAPLKPGLALEFRNLHFEFAAADPHPSCRPLLERVLELLEQNPTLRIEIQGHTDIVGGTRHNLELSRKRAEAVRRWLLDHGVRRDRVRARGLGHSAPVADNLSPEGRSLNRRTEFHILEY